ncbi:MAG: hypothetical protein MJ093_05125 [Saccharofermentans sp.]|nr:hypothetical protein [Saccharofermentans sp.]
MFQWKRIISLIIISAIILMAGCRDAENLNEIRYVSSDAPWYSTTYYSDMYEGNNNPIVYDDVMLSTDNYYIQSTSSSSEEGGDYFHLHMYNFQGDVLSDIDVLSQDFSDKYDSSLVNAYHYNESDYYLFYFRDVDTYEDVGTYIYQADYENSKLNLIEEISFADVWQGHVELLDVQVAGDNVVYLVTYCDINGLDHYVFYVVDALDGNHYTQEFIPDNSSAGYFWVNGTNRISSSQNQDIYITCLSNDETSLYSFNPITRSVKKMSAQVDGFEYYLDDETYVYMSGSKICHASLRGDSKVEVVADTFCSDMNPARAYMLKAYSNGVSLLFINDVGNSLGYQRTKACLIEKAVVNPHEGKQIVSIGYVWVFDPVIGRLIEYNNGDVNSSYYMEITNKYNIGANYRDGMTQQEILAIINDILIGDVRSGTGPDLMVSGINFASAKPDVIYVDLKTYLERDTSFDRDDYLPVVFDAFEINEAVYHIPYAISINGISIKKGEYDNVGFTYETYTQFIDENNNSIDPIGVFYEDDNDYFNELFSVVANEFYTDGRFDISSSDKGVRFEAMAEFVKNRNSNNVYVDNMKVNYIQCGGSFYDYLSRTMKMPGDPLCDMVGLPLDYEIGCNTSTFQTVSITKCCADKDAAWSLIESLFGYEVQSQIYDHCAPVRIDAFNEVISKQRDVIESGNGFSTLIWYVDGMDLQPYEDEYKEIVMNMTHASYADATIMLIISEEMPAYFEGQKSISDVTSIIENRVNNYIDEISS